MGRPRPRKPQCPLHGPLRHDFALDRWTCPGDGVGGGGCGITVTAEDMEVLRAGPQRRAGIDREDH
jgi:hypothetical protein